MPRRPAAVPPTRAEEGGARGQPEVRGGLQDTGRRVGAGDGQEGRGGEGEWVGQATEGVVDVTECGWFLFWGWLSQKGRGMTSQGGWFLFWFNGTFLENKIRTRKCYTHA